MDLDVLEPPAGFVGAFPHPAKTPFDNRRVGQLENHAVGHPAGGAQGFGAIARTVDGEVPPGPFQPDLLAVVTPLAAGGRVADQAEGSLPPLTRHRMLAPHPPAAC